MGQRHQIIVVYPEMYLNADNPNNKPERAEVIHHQWLYGRSAIFALKRALALAHNSWDGTGTDYLFGRDNRGYTSGDGTQAIAAAVSVCPEEGYYHRTHLWEPEEWNGAETVKAGWSDSKIIRPQSLDPEMFDNNDGVTLIRFKRGERKPGYAFVTPGHLEGQHWKNHHGRGPWSAIDYLDFYYSAGDRMEWGADLRTYMGSAILNISDHGRLMDASEVSELFPKFGTKARVTA